MNLYSDFRQALTAAYLEDPCKVLPNALWKSLAWADQFETDYSIEAGKVTSLLAEGPEALMLFWNERRTVLDLYPERRMFLQFALLHHDYVSALPADFLTKRSAYFRLIHHMEKLPAANLPTGFHFQNAFPRSESNAIANLIGNCYAATHPSPKTVRGWIQHPVFDPDLWVWVIDQATSQPAGLGIAEYDASIDEASLEWIQVLPAYRGQALGMHIVRELLQRLHGRAAFTTVSGQISNPGHPEKLYRNCGFAGEDIWWVLKK